MSETSVRPGWDTGDWSGLPPVMIQAHGSDGTRYVDGKTAFVRAALEQARLEQETMAVTALDQIGAELAEEGVTFDDLDESWREERETLLQERERSAGG
jgi:hypothetical protein